MYKRNFMDKIVQRWKNNSSKTDYQTVMSGYREIWKKGAQVLDYRTKQCTHHVGLYSFIKNWVIFNKDGFHDHMSYAVALGSMHRRAPCLFQFYALDILNFILFLIKGSHAFILHWALQLMWLVLPLKAGEAGQPILAVCH